MIKYRVVKTSSCMEEADLDAQWADGYELVAAISNVYDDPTRTFEYCYYFKYTGGVRAGRSVVGGGR